MAGGYLDMLCRGQSRGSEDDEEICRIVTRS
jgi:hypothetical protein